MAQLLLKRLLIEIIGNRCLNAWSPTQQELFVGRLAAIRL